ncbi:hypothetical protein Bca101_067776 [Brassica carinata]
MLFPSGQTPPLTISTTSDLVDILTERSWLTEITLLVTLGAKSVVEYEFLPHPIFSIGSTTYVVDVTHDARSKATYDSLVFGERLAKSERVMNEIFGDKEMLIFHRVALEMGFEDSGLGGNMVNPRESQPLIPIHAADAPSVMWDVGLYLLNYPEIYNTSRVAGFEAMESDFWGGLIQEGSKSSGELCLAGDDDIEAVKEKTADVECAEQTKELGIKNLMGVVGQEKALTHAHHEAAVGAVGMKCGQVSQSLTNLSSGPAQPSAPTLLKMNLASGDMNVKVPMSQPEKVLETSSEGSQTEGG